MSDQQRPGRGDVPRPAGPRRGGTVRPEPGARPRTPARGRPDPGQAKVGDAPQQAARLLAPVIGVDRDTIARQLSTPDSRYVVLARAQTPQVWDRIKHLKDTLSEQASRHGAPGLLAGIIAQSTS